MPKRYSSKTELKSIATKFAEKHKLSYKEMECLLIEVDRLKSSGNLSDGVILSSAFRKIMSKKSVI
jgi:hypothetical protein